MSTNMTLIETKTVGSGGAANIEFTSIPQTYTDLKVLVSLRGTSNIGVAGLILEYNSSSANLSYIRLLGDGSSASSATNSIGQVAVAQGGNATANTFSNYEIYIPNYASSNYKSASADSVNETNGTTEYMSLNAHLWSNTAAITSLKLSPNAGSLAQYSTASLYGISNVTSTTKATGGIVSSDGTYNYHMFPYSGTFTPTQAISADVLVIAGGGGASWGGGGAGGFRVLTSQSLTNGTAYTCTVGAGGTGATFGSGTPTSGGNSSVSGTGLTTITSTGGGRGAYNAGTHQPASTGGSGGGGSYASQTGAAGNSGGYTPVEGYAGGNGSGNSPAYGGGGGGGAGGVGGNAVPANSGAGGIGTNAYSSWANATQTGVNGYYAGGGGGGAQSPGVGNAGGLGGGGTGVATVTGVAGIANTGGGGGGSDATGAAGGSGLVIIRYAI